MSRKIKLDITQASYEELRCSVCSGYLSLAPIRSLPDGSALCGRCSPPNNVVPHRVLFVENLLSIATFPCCYKKFGCSNKVQIDSALNHEDECAHRRFPCASLPYTSCSWKGSASQVTNHFLIKHFTFVRLEAKICLLMDQDQQGVMLVKENPRNLKSFVLKYAFNSAFSCLRYQIRLCRVAVDSQDCKLKLSNNFDPDYSVNLKAKCFAYNIDLCDDNLLNVDMKSMLSALNDPENITVLFHFKLPIPKRYV